MDTAPPLFVGTANRVYAVDRVTGRILWQVQLNKKTWKFGSNFVSLEFDGESLFAAAFGELNCLDPQTGEVRWKLPLRGALANPVTFASSAAGNISAAIAKYLSDRK